MAELPDVFKCDSAEPMQDFEPIPYGHYLVEFVESEVKLTRDKTGTRLIMVAKVIESLDLEDDPDNKHEGRKIWQSLNVKNKAVKTVVRAMRELRSLCDAVGLDELEDSVDAHDIPFVARIDIETSAGYAPKNKIKKYISTEAWDSEE